MLILYSTRLRRVLYNINNYTLATPWARMSSYLVSLNFTKFCLMIAGTEGSQTSIFQISHPIFLMDLRQRAQLRHAGDPRVSVFNENDRDYQVLGEVINNTGKGVSLYL